MIGRQWLNAAAFATWLVAGLFPLVRMVDVPFAVWPAGVWLAAFVLFGAALAMTLFLREGTVVARVGGSRTLVAVQSICGLLVNHISASDFGGTGVAIGLLVLVAAQIPYVVRARFAWVWIAAQTLAMLLGFWLDRVADSLAETLTFSVAIGAFQIFAAASSMLARSEQESRERLAVANAELHATRAQLAERSRVDERLRISRDLHDTLGHHLTALSLQLDVAARISEGKAGAHIRQAHAITKLLLADVRDVVSTLRDRSRAPFGDALRALTSSSPGLTVHLEAPTNVALDPERADTLLRAVQEIMTNTTRHAQAANLWIRLDDTAAGIALHARDDGRSAPGAPELVCGHGLTGMRERFEAHAGHVEFGWAGAGLEVRAFLPKPAST